MSETKYFKFGKHLCFPIYGENKNAFIIYSTGSEFPDSIQEFGVKLQCSILGLEYGEKDIKNKTFLQMLKANKNFENTEVEDQIILYDGNKFNIIYGYLEGIHWKNEEGYKFLTRCNGNEGITDYYLRKDICNILGCNDETIENCIKVLKSAIKK